MHKAVLVTGAKGFIGKNLIQKLRHSGYTDIFEYDVDDTVDVLEEYCSKADFIFHLAGVNRPERIDDYLKGNIGLTETIINIVKKSKKNPSILFSSSVQALLDNPYGKSKRAAEILLQHYSAIEKTKVYIYRLPNLFGKWSRPNYNTVVATFCHSIARGESISITNENTILNLAYIDDVVSDFISRLEEGRNENVSEYYQIAQTYEVSLGSIAELINSFKATRNNRYIPNVASDFEKKLYSTYLSFLPEDDFSYPLVSHIDERGSFTEFIKLSDYGQVSVNTVNPGITKGNHWHNTKNEKFVVANGEGLVRFRKIGEKKILEYRVSGQKLEVVDIPVGYTHSITNIGNEKMVLLIWANECFDEKNPDTYFEEV